MPSSDDGEARLVYRSVLTVWLLVSLAVVLPLALARDWLMTMLAGDSYLGAADAMALTALGLAFFGAYYVVGVAVGRVKKTQLNWIVTGFAAIVNVALLIVLVPDYGATGAGAASAIAYFLMAILMIARGNRVFPVGYDWARLAGLCALAGVLFALGELLFSASRRGRRRGAPRRGRAVRAARAQRRSGSASRSAAAVTAACSLGARAGAESSAGGLEHAQPGACEGGRASTRERASAPARSGARTSPPRSRPRSAARKRS